METILKLFVGLAIIVVGLFVALFMIYMAGTAYPTEMIAPNLVEIHSPDYPWM